MSLELKPSESWYGSRSEPRSTMTSAPGPGPELVLRPFTTTFRTLTKTKTTDLVQRRVLVLSSGLNGQKRLLPW